MRIALATCQQVPDLYESEQYLLNELSAYAAVEAVVWNDTSINWSGFDMVIIRSTWKQKGVFIPSHPTIMIYTS